MKVRSAEKAGRRRSYCRTHCAQPARGQCQGWTPAPVIDRLLDDVSSRVIARRIARWRVWVAVQNRAVVGTSALDGNTIRMMFVDPDRHRHGIGSALLNRILEAAEHGWVEICWRSFRLAVKRSGFLHANAASSGNR